MFDTLFDAERLFSDPIFLLEIVVIALIIFAQLTVYFRNKRAMRKLRNTYPEVNELAIELVESKPQKVGNHEEESPVTNEMGKVGVLKQDSRHSETFNEIVASSNEYILRNKGGISFAALEQIAEQKVKSLEDGIESVLVLPLYIGLLGTFSGVIIGLTKIAFVGVSDVAIQTFLGGVLIAMIASAFGLYLTVRSNGTFKRAKQKRDGLQYAYFGFIRLNLLPPSHKTVPTDFKSLRYNLNSFHEEFIHYQKDLNVALGDTLKRFEDLRDVFMNLKEFETSLANISQFMKNNNTLMERQAQSLEAITERTASLTQQIGFQLDQVDGKLQNFGVRSGSAGSYYPDSAEAVLATDSPTSAGFLPANNEQVGAMLERLEETEMATRQMATQVGNLYALLQKQVSEQRGQNFFNSGMFKFFTFLGILAFLSGIGAAAFYFLTIVYPNYF